jgi:hypothetical protein
MHWDERLADLIDDLQQQAEAATLAERDAEVAEQQRAEYARVDLAGRLQASLGRRLQIGVTGVGQVDAVAVRVGEGWCLIVSTGQEWLVRLAAVGSVRGLAERAVPVEARPVTARLGFGSALRHVQDTRVQTVLHRLDGSLVRGLLGRVGADFCELLVGEPGVGEAGPRLTEVVPFAAVAAVRSA